MTELDLSNFDCPDSEVFVSARAKFVSELYATYLNNQLVGHGEAWEHGGEYRGRFGCLNVADHELPLALQGKKSKNQVYHRAVFESCHSPLCPKCVESWAAREGHSVERRILEAERHNGLAEHIIGSVPIERYHLSPEERRKLTVKALSEHGVDGGCLIRHDFRETADGHWRFAPHFHVIGFVHGGYTRCRNCRKRAFASLSVCGGCQGFEAKTRKAFHKDGFIVKIAEDGSGVAGVRRSIFETIRYQLSHASISTHVKRPHAVTWFGACSYRELHVKIEKRKPICPLCGEPLVKLLYIGEKHFCTDRYSPDFQFEQLDDLEEHGVVVFVEAPKFDFRGSGRYES